MASISILDKNVSHKGIEGNTFYMEGSTKKASIDQLDEEEKKEINYTCFDDLLSFYELNINGQELSSLLTIEQIQIWLYHKFRIYFDTRNFLYDVQRIIKFSEKKEEVKLITANPRYKLVDFPPNITVVVTNNLNQNSKSIRHLLGYLLTFSLRLILGCFNKANINEKHLILDNRNSYKLTRNDQNKKKWTHSFLSGLLSQFDKERIVSLDILTTPKKTDKFKFDFNKIKSLQRKNINEEYVILLGLLRNNIYKKTKKALIEFDKKLLKISESPIKMVSHRLFLFNLKQLKGATTIYLFKHLAYRYFFSKHKPASIIGLDEYSANNRLIYDAARMNGIRTIALQHGTMHELHPGYVYSKHEASKNLFPDLTILWGNRWKSFLTQVGNYPENSLAIAGHMRTDIIANLKPITASKPYFIFASQPQRDPQMRHQALFDVCKAFSQFQKDIQLIIKLHPLEKDIAFFDLTAKEAGIQDYILDQSSDLYQLINDSEGLITCFSTVGTETIYFHKPLIIYDPLGQDVMKYIADGVGQQAKNSHDIAEIVKRIVTGDQITDENKTNDFISENAYQIDGKTTERVIELIES